MTLSKYLVALRKSAGLTQREACKKSGIYDKTIAGLETGERSPRWRDLEHYLKIYDRELTII